MLLLFLTAPHNFWPYYHLAFVVLTHQFSYFCIRERCGRGMARAHHTIFHVRCQLRRKWLGHFYVYDYVLCMFYANWILIKIVKMSIPKHSINIYTHLDPYKHRHTDTLILIRSHLVGIVMLTDGEWERDSDNKGPLQQNSIRFFIQYDACILQMNVLSVKSKSTTSWRRKKKEMLHNERNKYNWERESKRTSEREPENIIRLVWRLFWFSSFGGFDVILFSIQQNHTFTIRMTEEEEVKASTRV